MNRIIITGGAGFIGSHLAKRLLQEGNYVRVIDIKERNEYFQQNEYCSEYIQTDLRDAVQVDKALSGKWDELFQMGADMGGAGYIFTGEHDADVMYNSALINLNVAKSASEHKIGRIFYSSSACIYPAYNQDDPDNPNCEECSVYPAAPDSEYGWEKLFSERLYKAFERNYGLTIRIARFHNVFGPQGTWKGGKEKAPAAICRKVSEASQFMGLKVDAPEPHIDIWGDGKQTRSFLYIDECIEGVIRLMRSDCNKVINIGSDEMISINDLAEMVIRISGKNLGINHIDGPQGVRGRNSDNTLIRQVLNWSPATSLEEGMTKLYNWVNQQITDGTN